MIDLNYPTELREAIELFYFAYRAFTTPPDDILAQRGLGRVHHRILYFVGRNPGIAVNALLTTLGVSKQALHAPLRQLVEDGLVGTAVADNDRRVKRLQLTAEGAALEAQLSGTQMEMLEKVFAEVGPDAAGGWRRAMAALVKGG